MILILNSTNFLKKSDLLEDALNCETSDCKPVDYLKGFWASRCTSAHRLQMPFVYTYTSTTLIRMRFWIRRSQRFFCVSSAILQTTSSRKWVRVFWPKLIKMKKNECCEQDANGLIAPKNYRKFCFLSSLHPSAYCHSKSHRHKRPLDNSRQFWLFDCDGFIRAIF